MIDLVPRRHLGTNRVSTEFAFPLFPPFDPISSLDYMGPCTYVSDPLFQKIPTIDFGIQARLVPGLQGLQENCPRLSINVHFPRIPEESDKCYTINQQREGYRGAFTLDPPGDLGKTIHPRIQIHLFGEGPMFHCGVDKCYIIPQHGRRLTRVIPGPSGGFRKIGLFGNSIFGLCPNYGVLRNVIKFLNTWSWRPAHNIYQPRFPIV